MAPMATYRLPAFWKSKGGKILNLLTSMQNRCLLMITGVYHTMNTTGMEIKASIPPINLSGEDPILERLELVSTGIDCQGMSQL